MTDRKLHIRQLMLERLTGIIPPEDDRYLQQLIDAEEDVRALWTEFQEEAREGGSRYFIELDTREELAMLTERPAGAHYRLAEWVIAIGIIIVLGGISLLFPGNYEQREQAPPHDSLSLQKTVNIQS